VTSREPLGIRGEQVVRVSPLATRLAEGDLSGPSAAVQLLQHRIELGGAELDPSAVTLDLLEQIARRLDGLPLALELAAARSSVLGIDGLVARLDGQLDVLANRGAVDARHATLHATIDWSYQLLDEVEQEVFCRLSVFADGCTLEAVEALFAPSDTISASRPGLVLDAMDHLVGASMVDAKIEDLGSSRFTMLESLRQYGQARLDAGGDAAAVREAHARYYRALAGRTAEGLRAAEIEAARTVDAELANLRAAYQWGLATDDPELYLEIPAVFGWWYHQTGRSDEMTSWLDVGLDRPSARSSPLFPIALGIAAEAARVRGDVDQGESYLEELRSLRQTQDLPFDALEVFELMDFYAGEMSVEEQEARLEATSNDAHDEIQQRLLLSLSYTYQHDDRDRATKHATRMLELSDRHGLAPQRAWGLYALAEACQADDPERARTMLDEAVTISQDWRIGLINGVSRVSLATANLRLGRHAEAARILSDVINEWRLRGNWQHQWVALRNAVELLADADRATDAALLHHAIENSTSSPRVFGTQAERLNQLAGTFPASTSYEPMTDDVIVSNAIAALNELGHRS
jgi:predicted ATPase